MKLNRSIFSLLGIVGALAVPAAVVAQFQPQQRLTAASLNDIAQNIVRVGQTVSATSISSNASGAFTTTTFRAQADGVVTLGTAGNAVIRTAITAGLEVGNSIPTIWRTTGGNGATFPVRDGQRFSVGGQATGSAGQDLSSSIIIYWTPLTADTDPPVVAN